MIVRRGWHRRQRLDARLREDEIIEAGRRRIHELARETGCTSEVEDRVSAEILAAGGMYGEAACRFRAGDLRVIDEAWERLMRRAFEAPR